MATSLIEPESPSSSGSALLYSSEISTPTRKKRERQLSRNSRPRPIIFDDINSHSPTASPSQMRPSTSYDAISHQRSGLTLPLFIPQETLSSSSPSSPNVLRSASRPSLQDSSSSSPSKREQFLPSHHSSLLQLNPSSPRGRIFTISGRPGADNISRREGSSSRTRRWSTNLSGNRIPSGLAYRLAEGASPYFRAGLDELRSIFDVDSDPIPISALDEDDGNDDEERSRDQHADVLIDLPSPTSEFPPGSNSPTKEVSRTSSLHDSIGSGLGLYRTSSLSSRSSKSTAQTVPEVPEKTTLRAEDDTMEVGFSAASLGINRGILAWSLALIAVGLTVLCAYGYAIQSDTFSPTLIVFFLTQPAFALMGLIALLLRRRALMDLFSRAMRAHVLAQACIVLMAYLDLSASSFYVADSIRSSKRVPFRMVPTMEMRFGPYRGPIEAGDTPGINLLYTKASRVNSDHLIASGGSSAHSHDTHVGDFQSRLTHLIVFIVQAALPIVVILIGQYLVAQRLAWLARRTNVSRQNSCNVKKKSERDSPEMVARRSTLPKNMSRYQSKTLPVSSLSSERLSSRLSAELHSPSGAMPVINSRGGSKQYRHARSLSQPLDFLSNNFSTELRNAEAPKSFLSMPLTESPPMED